MSNNEIVCVADLQVYAVTDKAIFVGPEGLNESQRDNQRKVWIPLSLIDSRNIYDVGELGYIEVPKWVAEKNDLEY